ncbi:acyl-CoA dehydrogenase family protein [Nocardia vaccinii]|uniref:acyl-CoA dehydrogenase family protein n=1 Tax=Nocardia vaccinii TaxID=1822 RepID=UPI00083410FF|nr:acyl-CoA dehydrogenase family protein [Nocardia vaccinii]
MLLSNVAGIDEVQLRIAEEGFRSTAQVVQPILKLDWGGIALGFIVGDESHDAVAELVVRLLERESARDIALWPELVDSGLLSIALPACYGGDGLGLLDVAAVLTELATDAVQVPVLTTLGFGVLPLLRIAPKSLAEKVFPAVSEGAVLTAALNEPGAPFAMKPETTAAVDGGTVRIRGRKVTVPYADQARWILVPTDSGLAVVEGEAEGLERVRSPYSTGVPESSLHFNDVEIPAEQLLPDGISELYRIALASIGAVADGLLKGVLTLAAEYVRPQDGMGTFARCGSVSRTCADIYVASRALHAIAQWANWALAQDGGSAENRQRVDNDLHMLAHYATSELPVAIRMCHYLRVGNALALPALHRHYAQAKDIIRWLGSTNFWLGRPEKTYSTACNPSGMASVEMESGS